MKTDRAAFNGKYRLVALALCLALIAGLLPLTTPVRASETVLRVGWYDSPFNRIDSFGRRSGYAYEYQQKIAAYTGWRYEYVEGSWPELMQMLMDGEIDLMSDVSYTPERAELMLFPTLPMGSEEYYLFVEPGITGYTPGDYGYFSGKKVGVNRGSVQEGYFQSWMAAYGVQAELVELNCSENEALDMLRQGELDGLVTLDAHYDALTAVPEIRIGSSDFYFAVNQDRPDLLRELEAALSRIQDENRFYNQELFQKYVNPSGANIFISVEESSWLARHGSIRVGYQDNYLAFCARDERTGELTGALKDYLEAAADCLENAHLDFEAVAYPSADAAFKALQNGEIDCMFPSNLSTSAGEDMGLVMTPSIMRAEVYALVRKTEQEAFAQQEDITVAVEMDEPNDETVLMDFFGDWKKAYFPDLWACMQAVAEGRADCFLISNYQFNNLARRCDRYGLSPVNTGKDEGFSFAVSLGSRELYSILTRTTAIVSNAGTNAALTYYSAEDAKTSLEDLLRENLAVVICGVIILMALILLIFFQRRIIVTRRKADESQRMVEDLHKQVYIDPLTHVRNKAGFDLYLRQLQEKLERNEETEAAIGIFDCNDLKLINDQLGHDKGNLYLKASCTLISRIFRHSPVFRVGGDEFTVVLLLEDYAHREDLLKQFMKAQEGLALSTKHRWEKVSVAVGVAEYDPLLDRSLNDTLKRADELMYEQKRKQKNRRREIKTEQ